MSGDEATAVAVKLCDYGEVILWLGWVHPGIRAKAKPRADGATWNQGGRYIMEPWYPLL